jgi:hypothetical protein
MGMSELWHFGPMRRWKKLTTSNMNQTLGMSYVGAFSEKPTEEFLLRIEETI